MCPLRGGEPSDDNFLLDKTRQDFLPSIPMRSPSPVPGALLFVGLFVACGGSAGIPSGDPGAEAGAALDAGGSLDATSDVNAESAAPSSPVDASSLNDANLPDRVAPSPCAAPASPGRGVVQTLYVGTGASAVRSLGVACGKLYLGGDAGAGARPWEAGTLRTCDVASCAATIAALPSFDLHAPARFTPEGEGLLVYGRAQPFSLQTGPLDTPGDVLRIGGDGALTNLGPLLDPAQGAAAAFDRVQRRGASVILDRRTHHNHGNYRGVVVIRDVGGAQTATEVAPGQELGGARAMATPTRVFAVGEGYASGALLVDPAAGTASPFYDGAFRSGFLRGERLGGVGWDRSAAGANTQVLCEADASCATPSLIPNAALPNSGYLGVFRGELVWYEPSPGNPALGSLKSCPLAAWGTALCAPATLSPSAPTPDSEAHEDGNSLYYVSAGSVIRIGL